MCRSSQRPARIRVVAAVSALVVAQGAFAGDAKARKKLEDSYIPFTGDEFGKRVAGADTKIIERK